MARVAVPVTHNANFGLYPALSKKIQRIYSGFVSENVVLTIEIFSFGAPWGELEVRVNGGSVPDGVIAQTGFDSRSFKLSDVKVIDLVQTKGTTAMTGWYTISVPL